MDPLLTEALKNFIEEYTAVTGRGIMQHLEQLAAPLKGARVVHINSTREGGGVAEILQKLIPFKQALGIDARWEVITGSAPFYRCTKGFHNALQGMRVGIPDDLLREYEATNARSAEELRTLLEEADFVFIHDPQPAALLAHCPNRKGKWIWRCHIDVSHPYRSVWRYLEKWVAPLRSQHLFPAGIRPAPAAPSVHHPAEHRSSERKKLRPSRRRGGERVAAIRPRSRSCR